MTTISVSYEDKRISIRKGDVAYSASFEEFAEDAGREIPMHDNCCAMFYNTEDPRVIQHTHCGTQKECKETITQEFIDWTVAVVDELKQKQLTRQPQADTPTPQSFIVRVSTLEIQLANIQHVLNDISETLVKFDERLTAFEAQPDQVPQPEPPAA